jgi:exopolysaccharide biosynthesis protein
MTLLAGVEYRYLWAPGGPWAVHLVQARIAGRCDLGFSVLRPAERVAGGGGRETVSGMVRASGERVIAAVNADFFTEQGTAVGVEVVDGTVLSIANRPTFAWRPGTVPWMGVAGVQDGALMLGWPVADGGDGETEAVGGFPDLIDDTHRVGDLEVTARPAFAAARHPRSAIGYDGDTGTLWLVVVDGRRPPHSVGMTLPELASLFEALGADEALNLDGGGSTSLVVGEAPVNRPSDATGERPVVNALALVHDARGCQP